MPGLCVDFGGTVIKVGVLDGPVVLASEQFPVTGTDADLTEVESAVRRLVAVDELVGVGIAVPGVVDRERGTLLAAHEKYDYGIGFDYRGWAQSAFGLPGAVENDARAALLGETTFGCAAGEQDAVILIFGTGIGTAAMIDGTILRGVHDTAGILGGHVTIDIGAALCNCGNVGCAEALGSTWALSHLIESDPLFATSQAWQSRLANGPIGFKELLDVDDELSASLMGRVLEVWGAATVSMCHAFDPEVVILAGGVMHSSDRIAPPIMDFVSRHLWSFAPRPRFAVSTEPQLSVLLGLSVLATAAGENGVRDGLR
jgi:glucokinase